MQRLRRAGKSIRAIAAEVFGHARYRGRVERIIASGDGAVAGLQAGTPPVEGLTVMEVIRELHKRRVAMLLNRDVAPSMTELLRLLEVQRRLDAYAQVELLRELTREPDD